MSTLLEPSVPELFLHIVSRSSFFFFFFQFLLVLFECVKILYSGLMKNPFLFIDHRTRSVQRTTVEFEESARNLRKKAGQIEAVGVFLFGWYLAVWVFYDIQEKKQAVCVFRFLVLSLPGGILDTSYRDDQMGQSKPPKNV